MFLPKHTVWLLALLVVSSAGCNLFESSTSDLELPSDTSTPDVGIEDTGDSPDAARDQGAADFEAPDLSDTPDVSDVGDTSDTSPLPFVEPSRILFIGNSYTLGGPVPDLVDRLAVESGWSDPDVRMVAFGGETLEGHRNDRPETLAAVDEGSWDVVVLQEFSTRPTSIGDPAQFKGDATWFHDRIKAGSPTARVILYETWARHPDHELYPDSFADPAAMQAQLRMHYGDAAEVAIPSMATAAVRPRVEVAPAGDAWELHLGQPDAVRLHGDDDHHAAATGQYLNALVIYATIYQRAVEDAPLLDTNPATAALLQRDADATTGLTTPGGPDGMPFGPGLEPGQVVLVDFGAPGPPDGSNWGLVAEFDTGAASNVLDSRGIRTDIDIAVTLPFGGINSVGLAGNGLGWPGEVSGDTFYCGSFGDHATGLLNPGQFTISGLVPGDDYRLRLFSSRSGDDGGMGRLTRYTVAGTSVDLEVSDNTANTADFTATADAGGELVVDVAVSPDGTSRFCYIGAFELTGL